MIRLYKDFRGFDMKILTEVCKTDLFTPAELSIVDFLLQNKEQISEITIHQLAHATYSSNATVIRFCQKLGFKGFRDFRVALAKELESDKYVVNDVVNYTHPFEYGKSTREIVNNLYSLYEKSIDQVQSSLNYDDLNTITQRIVKAKRIFLYGYGDVKTTLTGFINSLNKINVFPILATENGEEGHITQHITKEDLCIYVTYTIKNENFVTCANILKRNHVPLVVITANQESPVIKSAVNCIFVPDLERPDRVATFYSQLVFEYILSILYALVYHKLK